MSVSRGFLYVVTGERFVKEARQSVLSLKKAMPDCLVSIATDCDVSDDTVWDTHIVLNDVEHSYIDKILPLIDTPYEHTIYLDSDTTILEDLSPVFELLDRFDFCIASENKPKLMKYSTKVPEAFVEMNTGVMAYRKNEKVDEMIRLWHRIYKKSLDTNEPYTTHDQPAFREALYFSDLSFYVLSNHYNLRTLYLSHLTRNLKVSVLHDRCLGEKELNKINDPRMERIIFPNVTSLKSERLFVLGPGGEIVKHVALATAKLLQLLQPIRKAILRR